MTNEHDRPKIVMLGLDSEGKPHAARFAPEDEILAKRAAAITGLRMITVPDPVLLPIAASLPEGRVLRGNAIIPIVATEVYAKLAGLIPAEPPAVVQPKNSTAAAKPKPARRAKQNTARLWDAVKAGDVVLACQNPDEGWWPVVVVAVVQADRLRVRWRDYETEPVFTIRRQTIGFLHPSLR